METYFTFRYSYDPTCEPEDEPLMNHMVQVAKLFGLQINEGQWTLGHHRYNSLGELTAPHFHIHFRGTKSLDAYRKAFQRFAESDVWATGRKGVKLYSLKAAKEEWIRDIHAFFRYPFKMAHKCEFYLDNYFYDETKLEQQMAIAQTMYEETKVRLLEKRDKELDKTTTYDKFLKYVLENNIEITQIRTCQGAIINFYKQEKMSCNPRTMQGYVYTYCLTNNIMTEDAFVKIMDK